MTTVKIATRKSPLAMWQAEYIADRLREHHEGLTVEIVSMVTAGDRLLNQRLASRGGKGLFLKELQRSLLKRETDIAVHSMKDMPVALPDGLVITSFCERAEARDAFVSNQYQSIDSLPKGAKVGTASMRRTAQLKSAFPALEFEDLRGNVNSRLRKLDKGQFDAIILAAAGLDRLGMSDRITHLLPIELCLPAVGQGIIGIECRRDDEQIIDLLKPLNDAEAELLITAERALNEGLDGGCHVPVAGYAQLRGQQLSLAALVAEESGERVLESSVEVNLAEEDNALEVARALGQRVAVNLVEQGAAQILNAVLAEDQAKPGYVVLTRQSQFLGNTQSILSS